MYIILVILLLISGCGRTISDVSQDAEYEAVLIEMIDNEITQVMKEYENRIYQIQLKINVLKQRHNSKNN